MSFVAFPAGLRILYDQTVGRVVWFAVWKQFHNIFLANCGAYFKWYFFHLRLLQVHNAYITERGTLHRHLLHTSKEKNFANQCIYFLILQGNCHYIIYAYLASKQSAYSYF